MPPKVRLGMHVSAAGGVDKAIERATALGCDALQVFTSSPRQWKPFTIAASVARAARELRARSGIGPLVVHANYLINLAGPNSGFHDLSRQAFRGELERARAVGADYLVLHPGSAGGSGAEAGLARLIDAIGAIGRDFDWQGLTLLIENTAGAGAALGGDFGQLRTILDGLKGLPVGACIDTCHCWVAGYDLRTRPGIAATLAEIDATIGLRRVPVWHVNDAKAGRGSRLDRHQHIGEGELGQRAFACLLRQASLAGCAFIAETPVDAPGDQERDLAALRRAASPPGRAKKLGHNI